MAKIPIFAGLGSDVLFSDATKEQAVRDSRQPLGKTLLRRCHTVFVEEVSRASKDPEALRRIDLDDFTKPQDLIEPRSRYHTNPLVQNTTLFVVQSLRFLALEQYDAHPEIPETRAVGGFCVGLLTAVAVAGSGSDVQFLQRALQCFRAAILVGIASQSMRRKFYSLPSTLPWSLIISNISEHEMADFIALHSSQTSSHFETRIFISSINSSSCVTISGEGRALREFAQATLSSRCNIKATNIHSLYHESRLGEQQVSQVVEEIDQRKISFPSKRDLLVPLISTVDGSTIMPGDENDSADLLKELLHMILAAPTDWISVQKAILSFANDADSTISIPKLSVWNYGPGYGALTGHEYADCNVAVRNVSAWLGPERSSENDIAIVGVGIDLPDAPDMATLWENLMSQKNSCSEIPDRFNIGDYYTGDNGKPVNERRSMGTKYGCFLEDPFMFDNQLFGISPREARSIDPQQRLMLQTVYRALESAGYVADSTPSSKRESFGCFVGSATLDYVDNLRNDIDVYYSPATLRAFQSGRISYAFKWSGPSMTVDTACSSSLVAIYQAARSLIAGDCRAAVAGGVNVITSPDMYLGLDKAHFLSPTGQCKAFDEAADGYCRSEGCASFVLKRLSDAIQENDNILGVIKGVAVNQSGRTSSITQPHAPTQEVLFRQLLSTSNIDPHDISVVEAHGTGTQAGDPNELRSIRGVFAQDRRPDNRLQVTSLKSNIGHLEAASGGAALAKLLLMLKHKTIPPQALLHNLNSSIDELEVDGTYISTEALDWATQGKKRTAMLNNFGAAGSNGALLLQEYSNKEPTTSADDRPVTYVYGCSARSYDLMQQTREELLDFLNEHQDSLRLSDICYTSTARRGLQSYRLSTTATTIEGLITGLKKARIVEAPDTARPTVFLFSGQGTQYLGMGQELMDLLPIFKKTVMSCHSLLSDWGFPSCLGVICPADEHELDLRDPYTIRAFQSGVFVLEVALAKALIGLGLHPSLVAGHSLGEFAALVIAGVLDLESALRLVARRAALIVEQCDLFKSSMLAVNMPAPEVRKTFLTRDEFSSLEISCENSPSDCVVGGPTQDLERLQQYLSQKSDGKSSLLDVPVAYHTSALGPMLAELKEASDLLTFSPPNIAIASNVLGRVVEAGEQDVFNSQYFADHASKTVAFSASVADALEQNQDLEDARWVEIGPHPMLLPMIVQHGATERFATLKKNRPAHETIAELLSVLYQEDQSKVAWRSIFEGMPSRPKLSDLPPAPMDKKRYFVPLQRETPLEAESPTRPEGLPFSFLKRQFKAGDDGNTIFETPIHVLADKIRGHMVCGSALCPASIYTEMALAAVTVSKQDDEHEETYFKLSAIRFHRPLIYTEGSTDVIRISLKPDAASADTTLFEVTSSTNQFLDNQIHCSGKIKARPISKKDSKLEATASKLSRRQKMFLDGDYQTFTTSIIYSKIFSRVVEYSPEYQAVKKIYLDDRNEETFANCQLAAPSSEVTYAGQPILLDTMLHCAGFAANLSVDNDTVCICHSVRSVEILRKAGDIKPNHSFQLHSSNYASTSDSDCVLADAHAIDERGVIAIIKGMEFRRMKLSKMRTAFEYASRAQTPQSSKPVSALRTPVRRGQQLQVTTDNEPPRTRIDSVHSSYSFEHSTTTPSCVVSILSEATGVDSKSITPRTELSTMGVDSIMIFELDRKLEEALGQRPNAGQLSACKTVADMEKLVSASTSRGPSPMATKNQSRRGSPRAAMQARSRTGSPATKVVEGSEPRIPDEMIELLRRRLVSSQNLSQILNGPLGAPALYMIHPGAGICLHYSRLQSMGRDVYTIQDGRLLAELEDDWSSIQEIAQDYASLIAKNASTEAEIILGGWSFGGIIAFEVARLLQSKKTTRILGAVLLDPPPPIDHQPIAKATIEAAMESTQKTYRRKSSTRAKADFEEAIATLTIRNNLRRAALLGKYKPDREGPMPRIVHLRSAQGVHLEVTGLPENKWLHDRRDVKTCTAAWEELTGTEVPSIDIPGDHFTPFEAANLEGTTEAIREACKMLQD